jgi:hypothetical protein
MELEQEQFAGPQRLKIGSVSGLPEVDFIQVRKTR